MFINLYILDNRMTDIHVTVFWDVTPYTLVDTSVSVKTSTSIFRVEACLLLWILRQQFSSKPSYLAAKQHGVTRQNTKLLTWGRRQQSTTKRCCLYRVSHPRRQ